MVSLHPCVVFSARSCVWRLLPPVSPLGSCMWDIPLLLKRGDFSPLSCGAPIQPQNRSQQSGQSTPTPTKHICHAQILALSLVFLCFLPLALILQRKCRILGNGAEMYPCSPQVGSKQRLQEAQRAHLWLTTSQTAHLSLQLKAPSWRNSKSRAPISKLRNYQALLPTEHDGRWFQADS